MEQASRQWDFYESVENLPFSAFTFDEAESKWHWHDYIEVLYGLEGEYAVLVGSQRFRCRRGDFILINLSEPHATVKTENDSSILVIQFDPSVIAPPAAPVPFYEAKYLSPLLVTGVQLQRCTHIAESDETHRLLNNIYREYTSREIGYELSVKAGIMMLFVQMLRHELIRTDYNSLKRRDDLGKLMPAFMHIQEHYMEKIDQTQIAKMLYMSVPYFCRQFQRAVGMCFTDYVHLVRIHEAQKMILSTEKKISQISEECGFGNVTYFNRVFRKVTGLTPRQYRSENRISFR